MQEGNVLDPLLMLELIVLDEVLRDRQFTMVVFLQNNIVCTVLFIFNVTPNGALKHLKVELFVGTLRK